MVRRSREWSVLTWNIQGSKHTDLAHIARVVAAADVDVVMLQEAQRTQAGELGDRLEMHHTWAEKHNPFRPVLRGRAEGATILTPHELTNAGHAQISATSSKRSYKRRIVQWATISRSDATAYRVYNAHLSPHDAAPQRLDEAQRIARIATQHGDAPPAIVAGDLNDSNEPAVIAALPGIEAMAAPLSNPAHAPSQAIDHVLVPPASSAVSVSAPAGGDAWAALSDHLPVTVRFTLDWVAGDWVAGDCVDRTRANKDVAN